MIELIKNSETDNEKLAHLFAPRNDGNEQIDFSRVIVKKPWGYEYLLFENDLTSARYALVFRK